MLQAWVGTSNKQTTMNERYRMILCTVKYKRKRGCFDVLVLGCEAGCRGFVGEGFDLLGRRLKNEACRGSLWPIKKSPSVASSIHQLMMQNIFFLNSTSTRPAGNFY